MPFLLPDDDPLTEDPFEAPDFFFVSYSYDLGLKSESESSSVGMKPE